MPKYQLDTVGEVGTFDELRAYVGRSSAVCVTQGDNPGVFAHDESDTSSADDGIDLIVDYKDRRWARLSYSPAQLTAASAAAVAAAETAEANAETAEANAETAQALAEAARDAAFVNSNVYASIAAGLAAVADTEQFMIVSNDEIIRYRRDSATTYTEMARYPTVDYINDLVNPPIDPDTYVADLLEGRTNGLMIDATQEDADLVVQVMDTTTPANEYLGTLEGFLTGTSTLFAGAKLCLQEDGSFKYQPHSEVLQSGDPSNASWTKVSCTTTTGQLGPDGETLDATLLTATATPTSAISQNITVLANLYRRREVAVKAGTSPFIYWELLDNGTTKRAWFNTSTLAFETVDAGLTAEVYDTDQEGNALASGWRHIAVYWKGYGATLIRHRLGLSSTNGSVVSVIGHTATVARFQDHRGIKRLPYMPTTTAAVYGVPYDWTTGVQGVRIDTTTRYRARSSDDLTNTTYWTASNITPALNAVGPHGEPCSTITATAANGTITQAVTSAGTFQLSFAYVRRKTGTGTLEMSVDNGGTWTNVTSSVGAAGGTYELVYIKSVLANPTVVFRIGTSGDAFEVALFNVTTNAVIPPPLPSALVDVTYSPDVFSIPLTKFPNGSAMTFYADLYIHETAVGVAGGRTRVGFLGAGSLKSQIDVTTQASYIEIEHEYDDGVNSSSQSMGNLDNAGRLQLQHRVKANDYGISYNGKPSFWNDIPNGITFDRFTIDILHSTWLRRLLIVPEAISDDADDLRLFKLDETDGNVDANLLASAFVYRAGSVSGTTISRLPAIEKLYERGDVCGFITAFGEVNAGGFFVETPQRAKMRRGEFDRSTNEITWLEDPVVLVEEPRWSSGLGGVQGYTLIKIKYGPYRGRLVFIYNQQDSVTGTFTDDARNMYMKYSDDNGDTWSSGVKILDATVFATAPSFAMTGENGTAFQLTDGTHAGRVYLSLNGNGTANYAMWTDEFKEGATPTVADQPGMAAAAWSRSTTPANSNMGVMGDMDEPSIAFRPDGKLVMFFRNSSSGIRGYSISSDWGVTFSAPLEVGGENASTPVNGALLQADPDGQTGRKGRLMWHGSTGGSRISNKVQTAVGDTMVMGDTYRIFDDRRFVGYCAMRKAFDSEDIFISMVEVCPVYSSATRTSQMVVAFRY